MKEQRIPSEVAHVMAIIQNRIPIGVKMYEFVQNTIKEYPEWFPWETKYASIPKEVHDAYKREIGESDMQSLEQMIKEYDSTKENNITGKGILGQIIEAVEKEKKEKQYFDINMYMNSLIQEKEQYEREMKRKEKIFKKHYKKYGLEYRD
jgi:hypothetical protein